MTPEIRSDAVQPKRKSYIFDLAMCLLVFGIYAWLFVSKRPLTKQLTSTDILAACWFFGTSLLYFVQILWRLLWPDRALTLAIAINRWLERHPAPLFQWAMWLCWLAMMVPLTIDAVRNNFHLDLRALMIYCSFFLVSQFLRDLTLIGLVPDDETWPQDRSITKLKPIQSDQWVQL